MFVKIIKSIIYTGALLVGLLIYVIRKKTPAFAYQSMIHLFCITKGRSNDLLSAAIGLVKRPKELGKSEGVLGSIAGQEGVIIVSNLRNHGYHIFDAKLPEETIKRLMEFALSHPCTMRQMDGDDTKKSKPVVYQRGKPETVRYDFSTQDLLDNKDVQILLADMSFPATAQAYFGARPIIDVLSMWWHTDYSDKPDKDAAQFYHFDMDRPKWLKFFIYLTDVTTDNGPHTFVAASHKTDGIPVTILDKGYVRLTDNEVENYYGRQNIVEFIAPRGTIIAEDTRGLHKGKHVNKGDRLVLQIQFSNSLFGGHYPKSELDKNLEEPLQSSVSAFPYLYSNYK